MSFLVKKNKVNAQPHGWRQLSKGNYNLKAFEARGLPSALKQTFAGGSSKKIGGTFLN
jgi:hypothetical protein